MEREKLQRILYFLFDKITETRFYGLENLPKSGGVILATNHMSRMDIPLLFTNPIRPEITALVADKYATFPGLSWIINTAGAIYLDRDRADFSAFRDAVNLIKSGTAMGIAPEGTRSKNGQMIEGKPGMILLAMRSGVPIIPVGLAGTETAFRRLFTFRKPRMTARFGKPYQIPNIDRNNREQQLQEVTTEIMCRIAALLPEKYWGYYKKHPRLEELLKEQEGSFQDEWQ